MNAFTPFRISRRSTYTVVIVLRMLLAIPLIAVGGYGVLITAVFDAYFAGGGTGIFTGISASVIGSLIVSQIGVAISGEFARSQVQRLWILIRRITLLAFAALIIYGLAIMIWAGAHMGHWGTNVIIAIGVLVLLLIGTHMVTRRLRRVFR